MEYYVTRLSSNSHTFLAYHHFIYQNYQKKEELKQFKNKYGVREVNPEKEKESKHVRSKNLPYPTMVFIPNYMDHSKETDINYDSDTDSDTDSEYDNDIEDDYKLSFELDLDYSSEFDLYV